MTPYSEIIRDYEGKTEYPVILVTENGKLRELHKKLQHDCTLGFITAKDSAGRKTYRRSAIFILLKAIFDVAGKENVDHVVIHYSIGNALYFTMKGSATLDQELLDRVKVRMRELVELLNRARKAYEQDNTEIMSNYEYDRLYDELEELEKELGTKMANSPTVNVGYEVVSGLPKERHERPMLSLDKTKEVERLKEFLGTKKAMISWKLDGLTIVLTYQGGELVKAVTRGNGIEGEVITNNAKVFQNVPLHIPYQGELVLRGEAVISYKDFEAINEKIEDVDAKYKNPRNLCSGSVRQLNNEITAKRNVKFFAFTLVRAEEVDFHNSRMYQMQWLKEQGFPIVRLRVHGDILRIEIDKERFSDFIAMADKITAKMKELGFVYITLDAEGFRSGSMDVHIVK